MPDFTSPTPLASALSSLAFIAILAVFSVLRGEKPKTKKPGMFEGVIGFFRSVDHFIVRKSSWITGTRYRKKYVRLPILLSYFLALTAASVFLPWPFGMGFVALGVFSIFCVFRHWSRDEDEAVDAIPFEKKDIKIDGTLGAEVLIATAFLFVFAPTAFAQLQAQGIGFKIDADAGPLTFLIYTLIETLKAGSLIDYYDLYAERIGFEKIGAPTDPSRWAKITIMGYRVSLNLLLLAAIKRLFDVAKRRAEGADLRAVEEALRQGDTDRQIWAIERLKSFALRGRANARDVLERVAEPFQSAHWPIAPKTRFEASGALLDYGTQRGGVSALYAAADGYRALMNGGFDKSEDYKSWRAATHNLGNTLVRLGQQTGDPQRLREASEIYDILLGATSSDTNKKSQLNTMMVKANVIADLAMMTGQRVDLEKSVEQYRAAIDFAHADGAPHAATLAMLNTNLGATLADISEIDANESAIREAITAYQAAIETLSKEDDPETWSMAHNNLGNALADLGFWSRQTEPLEQALEAHENALSVRTKSGWPIQWAESQTNLANAKIRLAQLQGAPEGIKQAIEHYKSAQTVYLRDEFPRDWAWSEASLASAHIDLGHITGDKSAFEAALVYADGVIGGYASAEMPAKKAWVLGLKGNALVGLAKYSAAADAFREALSWQTYENAGSDWLMATNNLAACFHQLGQKDDALAVLDTALKGAPDEPKLIATLRAISGEENAGLEDNAEPHLDETPAPNLTSNTGETLQVKFLDWQLDNWNDGRFVVSFSANWRLEINGIEYHWRVTEEEYLEEGGQGKGAGYEIVDLHNNHEILYRSFWDHWMNDAYDPEQDTAVDGADWKIGDALGIEIFWAIYHHAEGQGISLLSRWDAEDVNFAEQVGNLGTFDIGLAANTDRGAHTENIETESDKDDDPQRGVVERHFHISVQRLCGEFVIGNVSQAFFNYWKDKEDFEEYITQMGMSEDSGSASPSPYADGRECEGWYAIDDIAHLNNAVFHGNVIYVDEVTKDDDAYEGFAPQVDGFSEKYDIDEIFSDMPEGFRVIAKEFEVDTEIDTPINPVFVGKSIEKGAQTDAYVTTLGSFDVSKLSFEVWYMDGDPVIASVRYDGQELEIIPDSSMGRAFYAYMGELI